MLALLIRASISLFRLPSLVNTVLPKVLQRLHLLQWSSLTCRIHCLGRLERHNTSIFSADFRSCLVTRSRKSIKCVLKTLLRRSTHAIPIRPQKANGSSCSSQQWHPRRRVYDCLSNLYRPGLSQMFETGQHKLLQNSSRAKHLA